MLWEGARPLKWDSVWVALLKRPIWVEMEAGAIAIRSSLSRELGMRSARRLTWKGIVIAVWVLSCAIAAFTFGVGNPSRQESQRRLTAMSADMNYALLEGGEVDSRNSNSKFGGALLYVNILESSWTPELANRYKLALLNRGWQKRRVDANMIVLCKNGVLATINLVADVDSSRGFPRKVYGFSMQYGGSATRICG